MTQSLAAQANELIAEARYDEALDAMHRMGDPTGNASLLQNIGVCHYRLGDYQNALIHLRRALDARPHDTQIINNIAVISSEVGPAEVIDEAVLTAPTLNDVGLNAYFLGDFENARRHLLRAIALKPDHYAAYHNLADMLEPEESTEWLAKIDRLKPEAPDDVAAIGYLRAHLHDQMGAHKEAIAAWGDAAAARRASFARPFNAAAHDALLLRIEQTFTTEYLRRLQTGSVDERRHIFIVGLPRSGSTLTGRLISGDESVIDLGERRMLATQVIEQLDGIGGPHADAFSKLTPAHATAIHRGYVSDLAPAGVFLDKYLENLLFLGLIWAAFPNARIIYTHRDRFDSLFSSYTKNFTMGNEWTYQPSDLAAYADAADRLMHHWAKVLPPDILMTSRYEELTQDPKGKLKLLADHCGISADKATNQGHRTGGMVRTASAKQVRGAVKRRDKSPYEAYKPLISF